MKPISSIMASIAVATLTTLASNANAAWTAPIGIPVPPFGVNEIAPAAPSPWDATRTTNAGYQFYYVCPSCAGATDSSNPYGYPAKPRATIPGTIAAGSVVELQGQIDSNVSFTANGTATQPVFVRGATYATRAKLTASQLISGRYAIVENIWWGPANSSDNDFGVGAREGSDHIAIRNCEVSGNTNRTGGVGLGTWSYSGSQTLSYVVIDNCTIHDIGDVNSAVDQDAHGITVNGSVNNLWVTNNQISYTSGDAMQLEAQSGRRAMIHHVYYGKNHAHHNKQTGGWVKHATDVIFSQNTIHDHRAGNSSFGQCTGFQYGPEYVWFLYNHIYSCDVGIGIAGNDPPGDGQYAFAIGNVIHNIHSSRPTDVYNAGAVMARGGTNLYFVNNSIYDVDAGFNHPPGWSTIQLYNNIVANRTNSSTYDIYSEGDSSGLTIRNNMFPSNPRFFGASAGQNSVTGNPSFVDPVANNFALQAGSAAIDSGVQHSAYTTFFNRYGIDISRDFTGSARPLGVNWDMGAHEFGALPVVRPGSPGNMRARTP